jgi:p-hydroxybenzoic acid efflux pump subunit AaeB
MGIFTIAPRHLRFAIKLACAVVLALFVGFHFQLETPRWAVLTAAIVAAGPAFAAGGEPYSGAIRYRGMLRIAGTFIGCIAALAIIILMIRAPLLMMLVCCLWAGFCTWISSLVRVENSYAWGLAGYTALIIIITIHTDPMLAPQFAVERCSEIVIGIVSAIVADLLFSPRSIKKEIDLELDNLLVEQYRLMQFAWRMATAKKSIKPGARWCVGPRAGRNAQQPDYGILALGKGESAPEGDQYPFFNADYPGLRNLSDPEFAPGNGDR